MGLFDFFKKRFAKIFVPAPDPTEAEIIEDDPVIDSALFNGISIQRHQNGRIEIEGAEYASTKAGLRDIAATAGIEIDEKWNTQYMGWFIIQDLNGKHTYQTETAEEASNLEVTVEDENNSVIDSATFEDITVNRKKNGSIQIVGKEFKSTKAGLREIAEKAYIEVQQDWNTQYMGWYVIQQLKANAENPAIDGARYKQVTIIRRKNGKIEIEGAEYANTKAGLKEIAASAGIEIDEKWNTQYMGWFIIQKLNNK